MKTGTPEQVERDQNWLAGIGLQGVDNLRVSNYLLELSLQNIKDEIDFDELERKLEEYHRRTEHGNKGVIYILTKPFISGLCKIGYADDIDKRLKQLNRSECIPFAFRVYATYEVNSRLSDLKLHSIIDNSIQICVQ